jgi:hypothetical protein
MIRLECTRILRHMIDDLSATPVYDDERLYELLIVAAQLVKQEVSLSTAYTVDLDELVLSPDPTETDPKDDSFINLICLKAACIIDQSEVRKASGRSFSVADSTGMRVDTRANLEGRLAILKDGWCKAYKDAKLEYEIDKVNVAGHAIMTPFRTDTMRINTNWR